MAFPRILLPAVLLCLLLPLTAAAAPPTKEQIAKWVEQLGDNDFAAREKASRLLWEAGPAAEPALAEAAKSSDLEVRRRAREVLDKFRWGLYPDTPAEVVALVRRYQGGNPQEKQAVVRELFELGPAGCATLVKVTAAEADETFRQELFRQVSQEAGRAVPGLIAGGSLDTLGELLELTLRGGPGDKAFQNHAAFWQLRGKADERIAQLQAKPDDLVAQQALAYLCRAKGDLAAARQAAEKTGRWDLIELVLADAGDWKELVRRADQWEAKGGVVDLGFRAAYHRLAGDGDGLAKDLTELRQRVEGKADANGLWLPSKALLANGGYDDALALLPQSRKAYVGFEVLVAQLRFREAFELADKAKATPGQDADRLEVQRAHAQYLLGDTDAAQKVFARYGEQLKQGKTGLWPEALIRAEYRLGLKEQAFAHAALFLNTPPGGVRSPISRLLQFLFPTGGDRALVWWTILRSRSPDEEPAEVMKRVRGVMDGKTTGADFTALIAAAEQETAKLPAAERDPWLLTLAETALAAGQADLGNDLLDKAVRASGSATALVRLGDSLVSRKRWQEAAGCYEQAAKKDQKEPLPVYLRGWALAQGGAAKEGQALIDLAHWLPLGDEWARFLFAKELTRRHHDDDARRERELIARLCAPSSYYAGESLRQTSADAVTRQDYLKAADCEERAQLRCLTPQTEFIEGAGYVSVPHYVHRLRARALAAAGKLDDARREIAYCTALLPGNVDLPAQLLPELEKHGLKKEADELFEKARAVHLKTSADYPQSAWAHNSIAWLSASCRRNLDEGLEHARKAVALTPDHAGHLDTLAEIHFQRGEQDKALELMKKCIDLEPGRVYYRKQLKRFEAGDRSAALPPAGDDT